MTHVIEPIALSSIAPFENRLTLTIEEAASALGLSRSSGYEAARRGQIPTRRLGRRVLVPVPEFLEWLGVHVAAA